MGNVPGLLDQSRSRHSGYCAILGSRCSRLLGRHRITRRSNVAVTACVSNCTHDQGTYPIRKRARCRKGPSVWGRAADRCSFVSDFQPAPCEARRCAVTMCASQNSTGEQSINHRLFDFDKAVLPPLPRAGQSIRSPRGSTAQRSERQRAPRLLRDGY